MDAREELQSKIRELIEGSDLGERVQSHSQVETVVGRIVDSFDEVYYQWGIMHTLAPGWFLTELHAENEHHRRATEDAMWEHDIEMTINDEAKKLTQARWIEIVSQRPPIRVVLEDRRYQLERPHYIFHTEQQAVRKLEAIREGAARARELYPDQVGYLGNPVLVRAISAHGGWETQIENVR